MTPQPVFERQLWLSTGTQVESTLPMSLVEAWGIDGGQPVAIRPLVDDTQLAWDVRVDNTVSGDRVNHRKVKHRAKTDDASEQYTLRFPGVLAAMTDLDRIVEGEDATLEYESTNTGFIARTWPPTRPWTPADHGDGEVGDVPAVEHALVAQPRQFYTEVATAHARALDLDAGQLVAYRFTVRDGALAIVADFDVAPSEESRANVRRVQKHQSGNDGRYIDQYRLYVPKAAVHALNWDSTTLRFSVETDRIVIERAESAEDETDVSDMLAEDSGEEATA